MRRAAKADPGSAHGTSFILEDGVEITFTPIPTAAHFAPEITGFSRRVQQTRQSKNSARRHRAACIITIAGSR